MRAYALVVFLLIGCAQECPDCVVQEKPPSQLDKLLNEEINYSTFSYNGFSVLYPEWPKNTNGDVELTVSKGFCTVAINFEKLPAKQWYKMMENSIAKTGEYIADADNLQMKYSMDYKNITLISDNRFYECQDDTIAVTLTCIEEVEELMHKISDKIYSSVNCEEEVIEYKVYNDEDFSIEYPDWKDSIDGGSERLLGISKGVCSIIVDKHNALPKDIFEWLNKAIEEKEDHEIISSTNEYGFVYQFLHGNSTLTATTKIFYCNYNSYITQVICIDEYISEDDVVMKNSVLESSKCAKEYKIPTPKKIEEAKEEIIEKEPEVIEEIDEIVKTNAGEEFGIDEELVVYFINGNEFFTKILKDFPKANLIIEDKTNERELTFKVLIDNGKIKLLEDGKYSDADVTLIVPLRDALNIFNNAENINPLTLLGFAVNVRTEPAEIKNEVIQKVLKGEY